MKSVEDFARLQPGAFDVELVDRGLHVGESAEVDAEGGAARGGLRTGGGLQVEDGFAGFGEVVDQTVAVVVGRDLGQFPLAQRTGDVAAH